MAVLIIDNAEVIDGNFNKPLFKSLESISEIDVVQYRMTPDTDIIASYGGVVLSGVPTSYDMESIMDRHEYMRWLDDVDVPVLGICLGHQSIGTYYGAEVILGLEAEEGLNDIGVTEPDPIFDIMGDEFAAEALHWCSISIPEDFIPLARSETCLNQIMRHRSRPIYGVQFHPELLQATQPLLANFVQLAS